MRTETDLRAAYAHLDANAPRVDDLNLAVGGRRRQSRRLLIAAGVAAAVVAVTVGVSLTHRGHHALQPAGSTVHFVCAPPAGYVLGPTGLTRDRQIIQDRLARQGASGGTVAMVRNQLLITVPGGHSVGSDVCAVGRFTARPLVAPAVQATGRATVANDPLAALPFPAPTTETAYKHLTTAQRHQIATMLGHASCAAATTATDTHDQVSCDGQGNANLLGPAILTNAAVASASANAPDVRAGQTQWTVAITLTGAGQSTWSAYTTAHNATIEPHLTPLTTACGTSRPCANYVAFTLDGRADSIPLIEAPITGTVTRISGNFTQSSATSLASVIAGQPLDVPLVATVK